PPALQSNAAQPLVEEALRLAARNIGADLEDAGVELPHRANETIDLVPIGDAARDRAVRGDVCRRPRARKPERAGPDRFGDRCLPRAQIVLIRALIARAPAHRAHRPRRVPDIHAVIEPLWQAFDFSQVFGEALPIAADAA